MARCRPRRRGTRGLCNETAGSPGSVEVSEAHDEALWPAVVNRYRPASVVFGCDEGAGKSRTAGMRTLAKQQGRKLASAVSKAGGGDGAVQRHQDSAEIHRCARFAPQSLQPPTPPQQSGHFQTSPGRRHGRVAPGRSLIVRDCGFDRSG